MDNRLPRRIRLVTGLVLFAYVVSHLANLALGLHSIALMDRMRPLFLAPWQNPLGTVALYGSLAAHTALGLHALYRRRTLRMTGFDAAQLVMALAIPPLMVLHVLGTRVAFAMTGFEATYAWLMLIYWKWMPVQGLRQVLVVMLAWMHGCMGLYYWLRLQRWWPRVAGGLYPLAFVVPVLALLGFVEGGKEALVMHADESWLRGATAGSEAVDEQVLERLHAAERAFVQGYLALLVLVLLARAVRLRRAGALADVQMTHVDGPTIRAPAGLSLLEISRHGDVPHLSVCGGRGRCGTCRVRILQGAACLERPRAIERATLARLALPADVRLACQAVPIDSPLVVERQLPWEEGVQADGVEEAGAETPVEVVLAQVRLDPPDSTREAASATLAALARYRDAVEGAFIDAGGTCAHEDTRELRIVFGLDGATGAHARAALGAARTAMQRADELRAAEDERGVAGVAARVVLHTGPIRIAAGEDGSAPTILGPAVDCVDLACRHAGGDADVAITPEFASLAGIETGDLASLEPRGEPARLLAVARAAPITP